MLGEYLNENKNNGVLYCINDDEKVKKMLIDVGYIYDFKLVEIEKEFIGVVNEYNLDILIIDV